MPVFLSLLWHTKLPNKKKVKNKKSQPSWNKSALIEQDNNWKCVFLRTFLFSDFSHVLLSKAGIKMQFSLRLVSSDLIMQSRRKVWRSEGISSKPRPLKENIFLWLGPNPNKFNPEGGSNFYFVSLWPLPTILLLCPSKTPGQSKGVGGGAIDPCTPRIRRPCIANGNCQS